MTIKILFSVLSFLTITNCAYAQDENTYKFTTLRSHPIKITHTTDTANIILTIDNFCLDCIKPFAQKTYSIFIVQVVTTPDKLSLRLILERIKMKYPSAKINIIQLANPSMHQTVKYEGGFMKLSNISEKNKDLKPVIHEYILNHVVEQNVE